MELAASAKTEGCLKEEEEEEVEKEEEEEKNYFSLIHRLTAGQTARHEIN